MKNLLSFVAFILMAAPAYTQNTFPPTGNVAIGVNNPLSKLSIAGTGDVLTLTDDELTQSISGFANAKSLKIINTENNAVPSLAHLDTKKSTTRTQLIVSNSANGEWAHNFLGLAVHGSSFSYNNQNDYYLNDGISDAGLATLWTQGPYVSKFAIGASQSIPVSFFTNNTERLIITEVGNIGIGTTTPQAKLAVNGDIFSKKIKVTQTGWPDYVFESTYRLPSLQEVEVYIKKHKRLPEVPSAAEVEKEGLDLGGTQAVLLKKIEELTLYIIEQEKRIKALEQKNNQQ